MPKVRYSARDPATARREKTPPERVWDRFGEVREKFMEAKKKETPVSDIHLEDYPKQYETGFATVDTI